MSRRQRALLFCATIVAANNWTQKQLLRANFLVFQPQKSLVSLFILQTIHNFNEKTVL